MGHLSSTIKRLLRDVSSAQRLKSMTLAGCFCSQDIWRSEVEWDGCGVGIYIRNTVDLQQITHSSEPLCSLEWMALSCCINGHASYIVAIYNSPHASQIQTFASLSYALLEMKNTGKLVFAFGDINVDFKDSPQT